MGYKNDQFYELPSAESAIRLGTKSSGVNSNKRFDYPSDRVRTFTREGNRLVNTSVQLKRGYLRSLQNTYQTGSVDAKVIPFFRCDFQFNPSTLQQSVTMRSDVLNMFLQDPVQILQPLASETQFGFQLFFDRTYTYNNETDQSPTGEEQLSSYNIDNIGVLHDLRLLYSIIGQGISKEMIEVAVESARNTAIAAGRGDSASDPSGTSASGELSDIGVNIPENFDQLASSFFNANLGNAGFLIPLPVRVVFSSLYMVDGYVTNCSVLFTKFSSSYVPLQCMVTLSMQAMYIGFAKPRTYLSDNIEQAAKQVEATIAQNKVTQENARAALNNYRPKLEMTLKSYGEDKDFYQKKYNNKIISFVIRDPINSNIRRSVDLLLSSTSDPLTPLFNNNNTSINVTIRVYGEIFYPGDSTKKQEIITAQQNKQQLPQGNGHTSSIVTQLTITDLDGWNRLIKTQTVTQGAGIGPDGSASAIAPYTGIRYNSVLQYYARGFATNNRDTINRYYDEDNEEFLIILKPEMVVTVGGDLTTYTFDFPQVAVAGTPRNTLNNLVVETTASTSSEAGG
jgi:hypothetical protein